MSEVVVVGAAGVDTCVYPFEPVDLQQDSNFSSNIDAVGQAGAYAARGYASLGLTTSFIGALGNDRAGQAVRACFETEGIDGSGCFVDPNGTARSVNLMRFDGGRVAFYDGRATPGLAPDPQLVKRQLSGSKLCHVNLPDWCRTIAPMARAAGATILVDLQDVRSTDDSYRHDFVVGADIVCFSTVHLPDPHSTMQAYWDINPALVQLAGMGANGCAVGIGGVVHRFDAPESDLAILDTNGAGDALAVGFASAYVFDGTDIETAAWRGQTAARITCSQRVPKRRFAKSTDFTQ